MKKLIVILLVLISASSLSQGLKEKLKMMRFTHKISPIVSYTNRLDIPQGIDTLTVHSFGIGIGFIKGDIDMTDFPLKYEWQYVATPYVKLDFNFANRKGQGKLFTPQDGASPILLSAGVTGGKGIGIILLPFGVNVTAGLATDFRDGFFQYGLAYDALGFSIGISGLLNFTNSNKSFYKKEVGLEFRYVFKWE